MSISTAQRGVTNMVCKRYGRGKERKHESKVGT